jgi:hypothetical protein
MLEGVVGLWAGVVTLRAPAVTAVVLVFFISIWVMLQCHQQGFAQ